MGELQFSRNSGILGKRSRTVQIGLAVALILVTGFLVLHSSLVDSSYDGLSISNSLFGGGTQNATDQRQELGRLKSHDKYDDVLNATIGFQEVFVVTLPERKDRLDSITVQAGVTGINVRVSDGVDGKTVPVKTLPQGMTVDYMKYGGIGCWRAHLNLFNTMVREGIQSALVLEDDADWDIALKYQMREIAKGTRFLLNSTDPNPNSPYGDDWDIIWIGHRSTSEFEEERYPERWVMPNDPTVVPPRVRQEYPGAYMKYWDEGHQNDDLYTRVLYRAKWGEVTTGYAISLRGALKVIYHQSMLPFDVAVDTGMGHMCGHPEWGSNFTCIAPFPRILAPSIPPGSGDKESDIEGHAGDEPETKNNDVSSDYLMYSTRMNIENLLFGKKSFRSKYGGEAGPEEMAFEDIIKIRGHREILRPDGLWDDGGKKWRAEVIAD